MIDKETKIRATISIDKNAVLLKNLEKHNINIMGEQEHKEKPSFWFDSDIGTLETEELYFDSDSIEINYSGICKTPNGDIYVSFGIPLSDAVLIDILTYSLKRLNKLKTALETLK